MRGSLRRRRPPVCPLSGKAVMSSHQRRTEIVRKRVHPRNDRLHDRILGRLATAECFDFLRHDNSEVVARHRMNRLVPIRRKVPNQLDVRFELDSESDVFFIERHGECDLPTRRHAEESRPAPLQGRGMSAMQAISIQKRARLIRPPDAACALAFRQMRTSGPIPLFKPQSPRRRPCRSGRRRQ
jgi:hypothetical protein